MRTRAESKKRKIDIQEQYRRILKMPRLAAKEIEEMRKHLGLLAQTICENVWRKKFY